MAEYISFDKMLQAIHNAVLQADNMIQQQHMRQLTHYFNEDGTPICRTIKVPNVNYFIEGEDKNIDEWIDVKVPLITLLPISSIKMKEMSMEFKVKLKGFGELSANGLDIKELKTREDSSLKSLQMDITSASFGKHPLADVKIIFEGTEPPEASLRISENYYKMIP